MFKHIVLAAAALACTVPAAAEPVSVAVPYGDLDLTKEAGRKTLDERLARAARKACGGVAPTRNLAQIQTWRACLADARVSFEPQRTAALDAANARRVAVLADKLAILAGL